MIRCIYISFDKSFFISDFISFLKLTSRMTCSRIEDNGYWFCLFRVLFFDAIMPLVISSSKSFISLMSSRFSCSFDSLCLMLLMRSKILWVVVNCLRCYLYVTIPDASLVCSLREVWSVTSWKRFARNWFNFMSRNSPRWSDGATSSYDVIPHAGTNTAIYKVQKMKSILSFPLIYVSSSLM